METPVNPDEVGTGNDSTTSLWLEIRMSSGLWIRNWFSMPREESASCTLPRPDEDHVVEMSHRCRRRRKVHADLASIAPSLVPGENVYWLLVLDADHPQHGHGSSSSSSSSSRCLYDGAKLELHIACLQGPQFGICFRRAAFVLERDRFSFQSLDRRGRLADFTGWVWREPSDVDRLLVNKHGREILYIVQPPPTETDLTYSDLHAEVCNALQIVDKQRVSLGAGPFLWGPDFKDDGLGIYSTYFQTDMVINGEHMKSANGAALIDVIESKVLE